MAAMLKHLKVNPNEAHQSTIIFLHGLGDSGHGWLPVAKMFSSSFPNTKWILPHAPTIPITSKGGMPMPAWYDVHNLEKLTNSSYEDEPGIIQSVNSVDLLIKQEIDNGIPEDKIIVGGFSQGGAIAMLTGLTSGRKLAGVVGLSTRIALKDKIESMTKPTAKDIPVFWGHGESDPLIQYQYGVQSVELLTKKLGFTKLPPSTTFARPGVRFESYPNLGHSTSEQELDDLTKWLQEALK